MMCTFMISNFFIHLLQMSDDFTNLHFSSIIQCSCMMETKCSSCCSFTSHQYCFCVAKKWVRKGYNRRIQRSKNADQIFCSSQCWSCANTDFVMCYCMTTHFLCYCEWQYSCGWSVLPPCCYRKVLDFMIKKY